MQCGVQGTWMSSSESHWLEVANKIAPIPSIPIFVITTDLKVHLFIEKMPNQIGFTPIFTGE